MAIVSVKNLVKIYSKNKKAIDGISFELEKGKIYGLLGPNGAGKSTLIHTLVGLIPANEGEVKIFNNNSGDIKHYASKLGFVPQNIAIYDNLTAYENVEFFAGIYGLKGKKLKEKCKEVLEFVELWEQKNTMAKKFSGGMQRRLNIACSLVNDPELIIFDEPTVGIDPQSRNHILKSILKINKKGITVIYTSHYMEEVEKICDYIYIMDLGKIIASGSKEELLKDSDEGNRFLVGVSENQEDKAKKIYGNKYISGYIEFDNKTIDQIVDELKDKEINFTEIKRNKQDLEQLFLKLTGKKLRD